MGQILGVLRTSVLDGEDVEIETVSGKIVWLPASLRDELVECIRQATTDRSDLKRALEDLDAGA